MYNRGYRNAKSSAREASYYSMLEVFTKKVKYLLISVFVLINNFVKLDTGNRHATNL